MDQSSTTLNLPLDDVQNYFIIIIDEGEEKSSRGCPHDVRKSRGHSPGQFSKETRLESCISIQYLELGAVKCRFLEICISKPFCVKASEVFVCNLSHLRALSGSYSLTHARERLLCSCGEAAPPIAVLCLVTMPAPSTQASIAGWLVSAGLEKYVDNFSEVSIEDFKSLLMQVGCVLSP